MLLAMVRSAEWDVEATTFDDEVDHGLLGPARAAWSRLLRGWLPPSPARVADLGCGTGSLAVLLAEQGYDVAGVDFSPEMLRRAHAKAVEHAVEVRLDLGDAGHPPLDPGAYDVVLTRHVLWDLPDQVAAIGHWARLLRPGGRFVLVEGSWSTGAGLTADKVVALLRPHATGIRVTRLDDVALWGKPVDDDRYAVTARLSPGPC